MVRCNEISLKMAEVRQEWTSLDQSTSRDKSLIWTCSTRSSLNTRISW